MEREGGEEGREKGRGGERARLIPHKELIPSFLETSEKM